MLYFLKFTFKMQESHIHSFLFISPLTAITIKLLTATNFSCKQFYYVTPSYVDVVYSNGCNTKIRTVLDNQNCGFVLGKDNYDCIEVSIHTVHRQQTCYTEPYLGVSHLSGIPFSFPIILLSEISQPDYVHVYTCNNVQIMHPNANIDETRYFVDPFQCKPEIAFF